MSQTLTISLACPIVAAHAVGGPDGNGSAGNGAACAVEAVTGQSPPPAGETPLQNAHQAEQQTQQLAQSHLLLDNIVGKLNDLHNQTIARHRADIARLAVEIARKILACRVGKGDYDIQPVIEEALKRAPARQEIVIRVNPEDLPQCQQLQRDNPNGQFAELNFVADWSIARADCLVETPKGIVKSFVEEHLARIAEALERAQQP